MSSPQLILINSWYIGGLTLAHFERRMFLHWLGEEPGTILMLAGRPPYTNSDGWKLSSQKHTLLEAMYLVERGKEYATIVCLETHVNTVGVAVLERNGCKLDFVPKFEQFMKELERSKY